MARPLFLKTLPKSGTTAYDFILSAYRQGISGRAMEPLIRANITKIGRTTINQVILGIKGIDRGVADLRFLKRGAVPNPRRIKLARGDILHNYSFTLRIKGRNPYTGFIEERFTQVVTDELISRNDMDKLAEETIADKEGSTTFDDAEYTIIAAFRK